MPGEYSTMQSIHFKLPSPSTPSSFIRFSLAAETPAELLEALKAKLLTYDINTDSVGYIDADGDVCQLNTVEDLESAVEHLETSAIILSVGEKKAGKESKAFGERKRGRRDASSSSSSSSSSSDSDSDVIVVELEGGKPGKKCKKGMKKRAKMMRKLHRHGVCGRKGGPRHLPFGAPFGGPFGGPLGGPFGRPHHHHPFGPHPFGHHGPHHHAHRHGLHGRHEGFPAISVGDVRSADQQKDSASVRSVDVEAASALAEEDSAVADLMEGVEADLEDSADPSKSDTTNAA